MESLIRRQEYICKFIGDLAKTIFAVGLASYFFKGFPTIARIGCGVAFFILMTISIAFYPKEKGEKT